MRRSPGTLLVCLVAGATACSPPRPTTSFPPCPPEGAPVDRADLCAKLPALCRNAVIPLHTPEADQSRAWDVAFFSEGYRRDELAGFRAHVEGLIDGFLAGVWFTDEEKARFNFYLVEVPADPEGAAWPTPRRPFGGCYRFEEVSPSAFLRTGPSHASLVRAAEAKLQLEAPFDASVVIFHTAKGRANAGGSQVRLTEVDTSRTLAHEIGHALFGLGDEYPELPGCGSGACLGPGWPMLISPLPPNLSLEPTGAKWAAWVDGAIEGGARFDECVYHPTDSCLMGSSGDALCPVCRAVVEGRFQAEPEPPPPSPVDEAVCALQTLEGDGELLIYAYGALPAGLARVDLVITGLGMEVEVYGEEIAAADVPFCVEGVPPDGYVVASLDPWMEELLPLTAEVRCAGPQGPPLVSRYLFDAENRTFVEDPG